MNCYCTCLCWAAIAAEKREEEFKQSIEGFNRKSLKRAETDVKNPLPTKEGELCVLWFQKWCSGLAPIPQPPAPNATHLHPH